MNPYPKDEYEKFPTLDATKHAPMTRCIWFSGNDLSFAKDGEMVLYMGEIANMPGHCVFANDKGKIHWGFHSENARVMPERDL